MIIGPSLLAFLVIDSSSKLIKFITDNLTEKTERLKYKNSFFSNMTHELRTPLNGIIAGTEILNDLDLTTKQKEILEVISFSNDLLLNLVNDLLDFSKMESHMLVLHNEAFLFNNLVEKTIAQH